MRQFKDCHLNQMLIKSGNLTDLNVSVTNIVPDSLKLVARSAVNLKSLSVSSCLNLKPDSIKLLTEKRQNINEIDLCNIYDFDDDDLIEMLDKNKNLVRVGLKWTDVTDECVDNILRERSEVYLRHDLEW